MATVLRDLSEQQATTRFVARVGAARWTVGLEPCALAAMDMVAGHAAPSELSARDWWRIMDSVRAKAVALKWYGGGEMTIRADELCPPIPPALDTDGNEIPPAAWFTILPAEGDAGRHLRLVDLA